MKKYSMALVLVLALAASTFAVTPVYQDIPTNNSTLVSGLADLSGPAGIAFIDWWVWEGGNGYYYYTYRIHNSSFSPYIKQLTVGNPSGDPYIVTGDSSGWNPTDNTPGLVPWNSSTHSQLSTQVDWISSDPYSNIYPGYSSWAPENGQLFQFASQLPPISAICSVRHSDLLNYASGLIPAPGNASLAPRSPGYWKHQSSTNGKRKEACCLDSYLNTINALSDVFEGLTVSGGYDILMVPNNSSDMIAKTKRQLLALWYNVISGKLNYSASLEIEDPNGDTITVVISQVIADMEAAILDPGTSAEQLTYLKDLGDILNNL